MMYIYNLTRLNIIVYELVINLVVNYSHLCIYYSIPFERSDDTNSDDLRVNNYTKTN